MRSDYLPEDLKTLWKELASNPVQVSPDDLRRESQKLRTGLGLRNWFASGVSFIVVVAYCVYFVVFKTALERIGSVLAIVGGINVIVQFLRRPARTLPDSTAIECIRFYRSELERQRDFHRGKGILSWLLPFLPGPIIWAIGFARARPMFAPFIKLEMAVFLMIAAIVVPLNLRMARRYQRRIDALDASQRQ
jgi:hypothetical protein